MGFRYDNQGYSSYLIYEVENDDKVDKEILDMLGNNNIDGLLSSKCIQMNDKVYIRYDISSSRTPVSRFVKDCITSEQALNILMGIVNAIESVEEYMLDLNSFVFDTDYIFVDRVGNSKMICLPIISENEYIDFVAFFRNIIISLKLDGNYNLTGEILSYLNGVQEFSIQDFRRLIERLKSDLRSTVVHNVAERKNVEKSSGVPKTVAQPPVVQDQSKLKKQEINLQTEHKTASGSFEIPNVSGNSQNNIPQSAVDSNNISAVGDEKPMSLLYLLAHFSKENLAVYKSQRVNKNNVSNSQIPHGDDLPFAIPGRQTNKPEDFLQNNPTNQQTSRPDPRPNDSYIRHEDNNFGKTTDFAEENDDSTMEFDDGATEENMEKRAVLRRIQNGARVEIKKSIFHIGRENGYSDCFIHDNRRISHKHADIVERNGEYFIIDTNSKGHTYINNSTAILPYEEVKLKSGDRIRLANEEFDFIIER